jgi:hypothetical protein
MSANGTLVRSLAPSRILFLGVSFAYGLQTRLDLRIRRGAQNHVGYVRDDALKGVPG